MRKNSVRKWLHAILDLLPLFVIPIFAIYTRNENYNSNIEINVYEDKAVELNNQIDFEDLNNTNTVAGITITKGENDYNINGTVNYTSSFIDWSIKYRYPYELKLNHKYYLKFSETPIDEIPIYILVVHGSTDSYLTTDSNTVFTNTVNADFDIRVRINNGSTFDNYRFTVMLTDLTEMFGVNNEPTKEQFNSWFPNFEYPYGTTSQLIKNYSTTTYNDTDVGSQFVYTLYNATDKYFNCTNLFNLEQVWNWVQLNLFGGNAPLMVYVVWQVIVYEFFMDLIFLLYSVFMFIIDFAQNCLEKPFNRIRRL